MHAAIPRLLPLRCTQSIFAASLLFAVIASAQAPGPVPPPPQVPRIDLQTLPRPPVPSDPLELVTGDAELVTEPAQRAAAITLLDNARDLSNVRAQPYDLKTRFSSVGSSSSDGNWNLEDISATRDVYRWTAQGPSYSAVYLYDGKVLFSNQSTEFMPLRLMQVREAIFYIYFPPIGLYTTLRVATGRLNGVVVRCILVGNRAGTPSGARSPTGGRGWDESEFCVDPTSGLLMTHSPAPGLYIRYDYSSSVRFHNVIIPGRFFISEAGREIIEAVTESVTDPVNRSSALFSSAGLNSLGVGPVMGPAARVYATLAFPGRLDPAANLSMHLVVVHGIASPEGRIAETELLASSDPSLNQKAIERANSWKLLPGSTVQPGATPRSLEVLFTFQLPASNP